MMSVLVDGDLNLRIASDPRLTRSQLDSLRKAASADPTAKVAGLDVHMRPVVYARLDTTGGEPTYWSLLRNGDPAATPRRFDNANRVRLSERWS